ncbi:hypothetical protein CFH99_01195 [Nocardioides aromaticivorans]|uniref:Uncharacterized protein n=1 Tax=Nocardioides aromaticivorans TaxID=200618 RepID=A0ABX7PEB7_9ACTN|nr:hypothetical protein CFH99_01195 [Nocardioides aromaticivorans]
MLVDGALHPGTPEAGDAEASYSSAAVVGAPVDPVLRTSAERIADALRDPGVVAPDLSAEVMTIESTASGWLLLVTTEALVPVDAAEVCHALDDAGALPGTRVFVADARRHLVRAC